MGRLIVGRVAASCLRKGRRTVCIRQGRNRLARLRHATRLRSVSHCGMVGRWLGSMLAVAHGCMIDWLLGFLRFAGRGLMLRVILRRDRGEESGRGEENARQAARTCAKRVHSSTLTSRIIPDSM
jgi:hypothetical protein